MLKDKLKKIREEMKMSQQAFAEYTGIPQTTISRIEIGEVEYPRIDILLKLMKLGYSAEYLLLEEKERAPIEEVRKNMSEEKKEIHRLVERALDGDPSAIDGLMILWKTLKTKK